MSNPQPQIKSESEQPFKKKKSQPSQQEPPIPQSTPADEILGRLQFQYLNVEDPFSPGFEKEKLDDDAVFAAEAQFTSKVACEGDILLQYAESGATHKANLEVEAEAISEVKWDLKLKVDMKVIDPDWLGIATYLSGDALAVEERIVEVKFKLKWTVRSKGKTICKLEGEVNDYFEANMVDYGMDFEQQSMPMLMYKSKQSFEKILPANSESILAKYEQPPYIE